MKKIKCITIALCSLFILNLGCSKDDDGNSKANVSKAKLEGTWRLYKEVEYESDFGEDIYNVPDGCDETLIKFTNSTLTISNDDDCNGTTDYTDSASYSVSGNIITSNGYDVEVKELTNNKLVIREEHVIDQEYEYYYDSYFEKQ